MDYEQLVEYEELRKQLQAHYQHREKVLLAAMAKSIQRGKEQVWQRSDLGTVVRALGDGQWLGEHFDGDRRLAIILRSSRDEDERLEAAPLATPRGGVLGLDFVPQDRADLVPRGRGGDDLGRIVAVEEPQRRRSRARGRG